MSTDEKNERVAAGVNPAQCRCRFGKATKLGERSASHLQFFPPAVGVARDGGSRMSQEEKGVSLAISHSCIIPRFRFSDGSY